jgi:DNA-directed RNA polymerase II subunit RPB2
VIIQEVARTLGLVLENVQVNCPGVYFTLGQTAQEFIDCIDVIGVRYHQSKRHYLWKVAEYYRTVAYQQKLRIAQSYESLGLDNYLKVCMAQADTLFVPLGHVSLSPQVRIADITVDSPNQSFLVDSQIIVHNSSMGKQALGIYDPEWHKRVDTMANVMVYPQRPLVCTRAAEFTGLAHLHHGGQTMVAILTYGGYNQEDSVLTSKAAFQRGAFNSLFFRTYTTSINRQRAPKGWNERFGIAPQRARDRGHLAPDPDKINPLTGFPNVGAVFEGDEPVIAKYAELSKELDADYQYKHLNITTRHNEGGMVDLVIPNERVPHNLNEEGMEFCTARVAQLRVPELADKFASRSANKGTNGMSYPQGDLPFTGGGVTPNMIMNPHGVPSRMTIAQPIEAVLSKLGAVLGYRIDATPFTHLSLVQMINTLKKHGYQPGGEEVMYSGRTGDMLDNDIMFCPTYYQRLKHMVADKVHARDKGPVQLLTRQPAEGRARDGGLRIGEMERDCLIAHGVTGILKERLMECSDLFRVYVSRKHGTIIQANPERNLYLYGGQHIVDDTVVEVQLPYAMKLLYQELTSAGINIVLEPNQF